MRKTTKALVQHYLEIMDLRGDVLELGGHRLAKCAINLFPEPRFKYHDFNIAPSDIPNTIIGDVTDCRDVVEDESFDIIFTSDVFEHLTRPWDAARELSRILRPGGVLIITMPWAWRNHPCPIDYWRISPEGLEYIFEGLTCVEKGYDLSERRKNMPGFWKKGGDSVPVDALGGFIENWASYAVFLKGENPRLEQFKHSKHQLAKFMRMDTQGTVTNPLRLGEGPPTWKQLRHQARARLNLSLKALLE